MEFSFKISSRVGDVVALYLEQNPNQDVLVNKTRFRGSASEQYLAGVSKYLRSETDTVAGNGNAYNPMVRVACRQLADNIDSLLNNGSVGAGLIGS